MKYWAWLANGSGGKPGYLRFFDRWLIWHFLIGILLSVFVPVPLKQAANSVLLPLAGIFIGLCFAWGGNANALLQTSELEDLAEKHPGGLQEYVFVYQTAILVVLTSLCLWGLAGLHLFDEVWPGSKAPYTLSAVKAIIYAISSLTLRECWHVVLGAQAMLLVRAAIRKDRRNHE